MRLCFRFLLSNERLPLDYRSAIISYFKSCLAIYQKGVYLEKYYSASSIKKFTFALSLPNAVFENDEVRIPSKRMNLYFSTSDTETALIFYNAITASKNRPYPLPFGNSMILTTFNIEPVKVINKPEITCKMQMPLCVRIHCKETNTDQYFTYDQEEFQSALKICVSSQIDKFPDLVPEMLDTFYFKPLNMKSTLIKHYGQYIPASLGTFKLSGDIRLLTHLYLSGMSSRSSIGFGYFNIID